MAQATAAGAGTPEQLIDVLPLTLARQFNQAQLGELGDLGPGRIVADRLGEVLQQLQLIAAGVHVDEIDDHHSTDIAQLELTRDLDGSLTVGPQHRLAGVGRAGERARVDVDDGQGLGRLNDDVTARRQIDPGFERIADRRVDAVMLKNLARIAVMLNSWSRRIRPQEGTHPGHSGSTVNHHPDDLRVEVIAQDAMNEILIAIEQHRWIGGLSSGLDALPLTQQSFEVVDQQLFADALGFGANQQTRSRWLDQYA
jgi:hypothetical protein